MPTLPVSGAAIALRPPDGTDDMLLHEAAGDATAIGLAMLQRLAPSSAEAIAALPITDFEFLLLEARAARLGPQMALGFACPHCRAMAEVSFAITDYVAGVKPRTPPGVAPDPGRPGWYRLGDAGFRLPAAADLAAGGGAARLAARCFDATARQRRHRGRVERAMAAMAPPYSRAIAGRCPACDAGIEAAFVVARVVVGELARAAGAVHDEIDLIARAYHWPQAEILALPQPRRRAYAERIRRAQAA